MIVPGSGLVKEQAEAEGLDKIFRGRRLRMARAGLLDVPGHEPRQARARANAAPRPRTAISRAVRASRAAPTWSRRPWRRRRPSPATSSTFASGAEASFAGACMN